MTVYRLGIDVGGTNTDAVILDENAKVIGGVKRHTTEDIETGIHNAMQAVLKKTQIKPETIQFAMLGTTQCTNAIVERKHLTKVGLIRLGYPATYSILPYTAWPQDLSNKLGDKFKVAHGGYEYTGEPISDLSDSELTQVLESWRGKIDSVAIVGVFSSVRDDQEQNVAELTKKILGNDIPVSLSSTIGSIGLIERENATILNAALSKVILSTTNGFVAALKNAGVINAKTYLCQNDGTLMSVEFARQYPILTIGSGPTNSIRGAAYLGKVKNAIVLDIGGTTSDIGVLADGFPRESSLAVEVGGIKTNFRMPDIISIGIGGGSIVRLHEDGSVTVGPDSVGYKITDKALAFGGNIITATDVAIRLGLTTNVGDPKLVKAILNEEVAKKALVEIQRQIEAAVDQMKTSSEDVTLILVGGGAIIAPKTLTGVSQIIRHPQGDVANAIGATIAQVSGDFEQIFSYDEIDRNVALADARKQATQRAITAGADPRTIKIVGVNEVALAYAPGNTTKVRLKVVGDLF